MIEWSKGRRDAERNEKKMGGCHGDSSWHNRDEKETGRGYEEVVKEDVLKSTLIKKERE